LIEPTQHAAAFRIRAWLWWSATIALLLLTVVLVPQMLTRQARLQVLRTHIGEVARLAASSVDGDLHRRLINGEGRDTSLLSRGREPLLRLHRAWPEARYVYTMFSRAGMAYFVLDTAQDAAFAAQRKLRGSAYLEPFELRKDYDGNWLTELAAGRSFVNSGFQQDKYGYFLTGHAPIHDSGGAIAGFVGVDFEIGYYVREERRFRQIEIASAIFALALSLLLGYLYARYRHGRIVQFQQYKRFSMQDMLTDLPNRRGAMSAVDATWAEHSTAPHSALLVDIDNFKSINDSAGHVAGDSIIKSLAKALRGSLRHGDIAARLGGDEFLIFARACDQAGAERIAASLLAAVRSATDTTVTYTVSIGISVTKTLDGGFDRLYHEADLALYEAKRTGRDKYVVHGVA
jgi:diguanylate cyclase (GGDEF)-like protein